MSKLSQAKQTALHDIRQDKAARQWYVICGKSYTHSVIIDETLFTAEYMCYDDLDYLL